MSRDEKGYLPLEGGERWERSSERDEGRASGLNVLERENYWAGRGH